MKAPLKALDYTSSIGQRVHVERIVDDQTRDVTYRVVDEEQRPTRLEGITYPHVTYVAEYPHIRFARSDWADRRRAAAKRAIELSQTQAF